MALAQNISRLQSSAERQLHALNTEEKTKNALVLPFFDLLGYDPFDLRDVEPGYAVNVQDGGTHEVDYAVKVEGSPAILFQCEKAETDLDYSDGDPLFQSSASFDPSIVGHTNGLTYRLYAAFEAEGRIAERPFLEFELLDYSRDDIEELQVLTKSSFDTDEVMTLAFNRTYGPRLSEYLAEQQQSPSHHFVRYLAAQVLEGDVTKEAVERFRPLVKDVLRQSVETEFDARPERAKQSEPQLEVSGHDASQTEAPNQNGAVREATRQNGSLDEAPSPNGPESEATEQAEVDGEASRETDSQSDTSSPADESSLDGGVQAILQDFETPTGGDGDGAPSSAAPSPSPRRGGSENETTSPDSEADPGSQSGQPENGRSDDERAGAPTGDEGKDAKPREDNIATEFAQKVLGRS